MLNLSARARALCLFLLVLAFAGSCAGPGNPAAVLDLQSAALEGTVITCVERGGDEGFSLGVDEAASVDDLADGSALGLTAKPLSIGNGPLSRAPGTARGRDIILDMDVGARPDRLVVLDRLTGERSLRPFARAAEGTLFSFMVRDGEEISLLPLRMGKAVPSSKSINAAGLAKPFTIDSRSGRTVSMTFNHALFKDDAWVSYTVSGSWSNNETGQSGSLGIAGTAVSFSAPVDGSYEIKLVARYKVWKTKWLFTRYLAEERLVLWRQDVAVEAGTLTAEQRAVLARRYAPIVVRDAGEYYRPASLEYIFNNYLPDAGIASEEYTISSPLDIEPSGGFSDLAKAMPFWGHKDSWFNVPNAISAWTSGMAARTNPYTPVIYYTVQERPLQERIYIHYHFLYPYDLKNGTPWSVAWWGFSHIFDRESVTVVLDAMRIPIGVIYAGHMRNSSFAISYRSPGLLDVGFGAGLAWHPECMIRPWGANWVDALGYEGEFNDSVLRAGDHPAVFIARGAHAAYPYPGQYNTGAGDDYAGMPAVSGYAPERILVPSWEDFKGGTGYSLRELGSGTYTSSSWNSWLAYSGMLVDVAWPAGNEPFPPHCEREKNLKDYEKRALDNRITWDWLHEDDWAALSNLDGLMSSWTGQARSIQPYR